MFVPGPNMGQLQLTGAGLVTFWDCLIQSCHTCVVPWKNVLFLVVLLAKAEEFTLGWLAERYMSHMFVSCGVHVARE